MSDQPDDLVIDVEDVDGAVMIVRIVAAVWSIDLIGEVSRIGRVLRIEKAHVQGASPGKVGRAGLNEIGRKLMAEADVDQIVLQGSTRTTGSAKGRVPRPIWFPHRGGPGSDR